MNPGASPRPARRIVISGFFGGINAGDEAILSGTLSALREIGAADFAPAPGITVLSERPAHTRSAHGTAALANAPRSLKAAAVVAPRGWSPRIWSLAATASPAARAAIAKSDLFILGGGGLLGDEIPGLLTSWTARLRYAQSRGIPTMIHAAGASGLNSSEARKVAAEVLNHVDAITVRDEESADRLIGAGVNADRISVTADPAFRCAPCPPHRADEILTAAGVPADAPLIGLVFRPHFRDRRRWSGADCAAAAERYEREVARLLKGNGERGDFHTVVLPFQRPMDVRFMREMISASGMSAKRVTILDRPTDTAEMLGLCARMDVMVAMRLHAMICCTIAGTPFTGIDYSAKTKSFIRRAGWEDRSLRVEDFTAERTLKLIDEAITDRTQWSDRLLAVARIEREKERANLAVLNELLARGDADRKGATTI